MIVVLPQTYMGLTDTLILRCQTTSVDKRLRLYPGRRSLVRPSWQEFKRAIPLPKVFSNLQRQAVAAREVGVSLVGSYFLMSRSTLQDAETASGTPKRRNAKGSICTHCRQLKVGPLTCG